MRYKTYFIILILWIFFLSGCNRPKQTGVGFDEIDTSQEPIQTPVSSPEPIIKGVKHGTFTIMPVAKYKLSGRVVGKKSYSDDWDGLVSPMDLAMAWGELAGLEYGKYITFSQSSRWYHYKLKEKSPYDLAYVITHSANSHIIPDNENIHRAIKTIKKKDGVILEGWLINLKGVYRGRNVFWNTSLSRNDTGNGSCELFYVLKVRINNRVYE